MSEPPRDLHLVTWRTLRALRAGARLSRNRHFDLFNDPRARRAIRLHRYLIGLARDVRAHGHEMTVTVVGGDEGNVALCIELPTLHGRRTAYLSRTELDLLAEEAPGVALLLGAHLDRERDAAGDAARAE